MSNSLTLPVVPKSARKSSSKGQLRNPFIGYGSFDWPIISLEGRAPRRLFTVPQLTLSSQSKYSRYHSRFLKASSPVATRALISQTLCNSRRTLVERICPVSRISIHSKSTKFHQRRSPSSFTDSGLSLLGAESRPELNIHMGDGGL